MLASTARESDMDERAVAGYAEQLAKATLQRVAVRQLSAQSPGMDVADAYRIQQVTVATRLAGGESIVGWKVGLTSRAMQQQLGVDQPDYAPILSGWLLRDGDSVPRSDLIAPRVEAEIGFVLDRELSGPGVTREDVIAATRGVCPTIEVIDSRILDWKLTLPDTVADMASSARVVWGEPLTPLSEELDLVAIGVLMERNGEAVGQGTGAAVLGDPVTAVAWAANTLGALGVTMLPGQLVIPGAMHASVPANAGDVFRATFDRLGRVQVRFS
jgi:2-keto-4-pentenoate hydratase